MADSDFFKEFRKTYKPKKTRDITRYLKFRDLNDFQVLTKENITKMIPEMTYIRLISKSDAFENHKYSPKVIQDGGHLLAGGYYSEGSFKKTSDYKKWTHLQLDTVISKKTGKEQKKFYKYNIKLSNYYVFFIIMKNINIMDVLLANIDLIVECVGAD